MNIFLTSKASMVLPKLCEFFPKPPAEYKVVFIPTASNPYSDAPWVREDREKLISLGFTVNDLDLDGATREEMEKAVNNADIVFVAGGNSFYLLEKIKKTGFDEIIKTPVSNGKIYIGSSAGSMVAAPDIEPAKFFDDREKSNLDNTLGIGLVEFVILPHFDNPKYKELNDKTLREYQNWKYRVVPTNDNQFVVPKGEGSEFEVRTQNGFTPKQEKEILRETAWLKKHGKRYKSAKEMHRDILGKG